MSACEDHATAGAHKELPSERGRWKSLGLLVKSTAPSGATTTYAYDLAGNLLKTTGPQGTTTYAYNAVNEPTQATDPWSGTSTFSYVAGRDTKLAQIAFPNGVTQAFTYDASGRLTSLVAKNSSGATLINHAYAYTNSSGADTALLQHETTTAGNTTAYTYDALDRLTQASTTSPSGAAVSSSAYGYDGASNRTSRTAGGATTSYSYNQAGELTSQGAVYDASGNLTSVAGLSASYNAAGQTAQVTPAGNPTSAFAYAGASQDQLTTAGSTAISPSGLGIAQTTQTTGTTTTTTGYAYTPQGALLAQHASSGTSTPEALERRAALLVGANVSPPHVLRVRERDVADQHVIRRQLFGTPDLCSHR